MSSSIQPIKQLMDIKMLSNIAKIILQIEILHFCHKYGLTSTLQIPFDLDSVRLGYRSLSFQAWVTKNRQSCTVYALKDTFTQPFNLLQSESHI
jgi:hypothetical protein